MWDWDGWFEFPGMRMPKNENDFEDLINRRIILKQILPKINIIEWQIIEVEILKKNKKNYGVRKRTNESTMLFYMNVCWIF